MTQTTRQQQRACTKQTRFTDQKYTQKPLVSDVSVETAEVSYVSVYTTEVSDVRGDQSRASDVRENTIHASNVEEDSTGRCQCAVLR